MGAEALHKIGWVGRHTSALVIESWIAAPASGAAARVEMVVETPPSGQFKPTIQVSVLRTGRFGRTGALGILAVEVFTVAIFLAMSFAYHRWESRHHKRRIFHVAWVFVLCACVYLFLCLCV